MRMIREYLGVVDEEMLVSSPSGMVSPWEDIRLLTLEVATNLTWG